jgi:hypothetical protein
VVAAGLVALAIPASASGQGVPDASCPRPPEVGAFFSDGNARFAQTFTAQADGDLVLAQVDVVKQGTSADWVISINGVDASGTPTNTVLASTVIPDSTVPDGESIITVNFASPATLTAGQQYALVVTRPGSDRVTVGVRQGDDCPGQLFTSTSQTGAFTPSLIGDDLFFFVFVAPPAAPDTDTTPPSATITKGPKDKTKKKQATFTFSGSDARAVASFQCSLDGAVFTTCTSPHTVKVKKGKHTFKVQAVDEAGNVGAPASDTWKRKKKSSNSGSASIKPHVSSMARSVTRRRQLEDGRQIVDSG